MHLVTLTTALIAGALLSSPPASHGSPLSGADVPRNVDIIIGATRDILQGSEATERQAGDARAHALGSPATADDVTGADSADLNSDAFVTLDEVIALKEAGLDDEDILDRMAGTEQIFELSRQQKAVLVEAGISPRAVERMSRINR